MSKLKRVHINSAVFAKILLVEITGSTKMKIITKYWVKYAQIWMNITKIWKIMKNMQIMYFYQKNHEIWI